MYMNGFILKIKQTVRIGPKRGRGNPCGDKKEL